MLLRARQQLQWALRPDRERWFDATCAIVALVCLAQILLMRFGRDQGIYAMVAASLLNGELPYRDAWDFKPPGIFGVYAGAQLVFGANEWGIRVVEALCLASLWPALRSISRRLFHDARAGSVAATLTILMEAELEFWHTAQPETFGGVLSIWAFALVLGVGSDLRESNPRTADRLWKTALAGILFGLAALMKPHFAGGAAVAVVFLLTVARRAAGKIRAASIEGVTLLVSSTLPVLASLAWFAAHGGLQDLVQTLFVFAPGYVSTTFSLRGLPTLLYSAAVGTTFGFSALVPVGLLFGLLAHRQDRGDTRTAFALVIAMSVPQFAGLALQAKFFPYHHAGLLPLMALLAAPGLVSAWEFVSRRGWWGRAPALAVVPILLDVASSTRDLPDSFLQRSWERTRSLLIDTREQQEVLAARLYSVADVSYGANVEVAKWMSAHTAPEDRVYLWGFEPFVYFAAQRRPASRFIYNVPQRSAWSKDWARPALIRELEATRPKVVGVLRHDVFPMVTGDVLDSRDTLQSFSELRILLDTRYRLATRIEDFELYLRLPDEQPGIETSVR